MDLCHLLISSKNNSNFLHDIRRFNAFCGGMVLTICMFVMIGWTFDISLLKSIRPSWAAMTVPTAVCFIFAGLALLAIELNRPWVYKGSATLVLIISLFTMNQPSTAFCLFLLGLCLLVVGKEWGFRLIHPSCLLVIFISTLILMNYSHGINFDQFLFPFATASSFYTMLILILISVGILTIPPAKGMMALFANQAAAGMMVRRLLPAMLLAIFSIGFLTHTGINLGWYEATFGMSLVTILSAVVVGVLLFFTAKVILHLDEEKERIRGVLQAVKIEEFAKREAHRRFRCLVDSSIVGIFVTDLNYIGEANDVFLKIMGYGRNDLPLCLDKMTPHEYRELDEWSKNELKKKGAVASWQMEYYRKDGSRVPILLGINHLDAQEGSYLCFVVDRTEQKRLEKIKDEFISMVSHELRVPLAVVGMGLENLAGGLVGQLTEDQLAVVTRGQRNIKRLSTLIHNLLDLSRLQSGQINMCLSNCDVKKIIEEVLENGNFSKDIEKNRITIKKDLPGTPLLTKADPEMVAQILTNLLENAKRYARREIGIESHLVNETGDKNPSIEVCISNDGPGLDPSQIKKLFETFVQIDREKNKGSYKGTGLGLAICKAIVDRHEGKIWAQSQGKWGMDFHFTLPLGGGDDRGIRWKQKNKSY